MRQPIAPDPVPSPPPPGASRAKGLLAIVFMVGATSILVALGAWAVRGLSSLPAVTVEDGLTAGVTAARIRAGAGLSEPADAASDDAPADPGAAEAGPQAAAEPPPAEESGGVRYVEGAGIVATRVEGPLTRAPSTVVIPEKVPEGPKPTLYRLVVIEDADTVNLRSHTVQLAHVTGPEADETCTNAAGVTWPCGMRARTALRRLVRRRALECLDLPAPEGAPRRATCAAGGTDLSTWLVQQGWARPAEDAPEALKELHAAAESARRGLYDPAGR